MIQATTSAIPAEIVTALLDEVEGRADETISFLQELVQYRTENPKLVKIEPGAEAECQAFIASKLKQLGLEIETWEVYPKRPDLVGLLRGSGGGKSLILNGHIDVVPAGDPAQWPHDPWAAEIHEGKIWGRGTCDMKGASAASPSPRSIRPSITRSSRLWPRPMRQLLDRPAIPALSP